jgi:hypothetical protein
MSWPGGERESANNPPLYDAIQCPLRVNRAILTVGQSLPVYPDQRTFSEYVGMSQRCHELTMAADKHPFYHAISRCSLILEPPRAG